MIVVPPKKNNQRPQVIKRLPDVKPLYDMLPKGTESGKEFARIVDLLLFHQARRTGRNLTIFDDRAGDFNGLDAFEKSVKERIGFQYKFYPSPLSDEHRNEIIASLKKTVASDAKEKKAGFKLTKWILITPTDFINSARRRDGGDVAWFTGLRIQCKAPFEIEHWGHKQLLELFLEAPPIGLFYYPELFPDGTARRKTIQDLRARYDEAFNEQYRKIEFVGMSVYKEEASRGVPMENIYIPLSVIPNEADENDENVARSNPIEFLAPGSRHVILGDPGSGKTTLLKFLALFGQSEALHKRYSGNCEGRKKAFQPDERLPILITLRRYADALKADDNLGLIEYIRRNIEADFSISGTSTEFVECYLESGQAILLFDGMDELPNPSFKKKIRDRIQTLCKTYPGNTVISTSRIFGYDEIRFNDKEFIHHRLTKLQMPDIEQFVRDWYAARIESKRERGEHMESLLGILRNEEHVSIRELASNPLLLTIIVLVHRIDAVLPDERVVLYQKCTETLLNTWHIWKFHDRDALHRAKVDRLNHHRMQAIAHWMHHQSGGAHAGQQAVVSYKNLHTFLTKQITLETPPDPEYAPEDIASEFLKFVQDRAGLLIEVGDQQFSFVHLTFQEYLTAAHITTIWELEGVKTAWSDEISDHCSDPRWREVIRLLVASCKADASQEFLLGKLLETKDDDLANTLLLGGLYLDGISSAQQCKSEIIRRLLLSAAHSSDKTPLQSTLQILRSCREKDGANDEALRETMRELCATTKSKEIQLRHRLNAMSLGWSVDDIDDLCGHIPEERDKVLFSLFFGSETNVHVSEHLKEDAILLCDLMQSYLLTSSAHNFIATSMESIASILGQGISQSAFSRALTVLCSGHYLAIAPVPDYFFNAMLLSKAGETLSLKELARVRRLALDQARMNDRIGSLDQTRVGDRPGVLDRAMVRAGSLDRSGTMDRARALFRDRARSLDRPRALALDRDRDRALDRDRHRALDRTLNQIARGDSPQLIREQLLANPTVFTPILETIYTVFNLAPGAQWLEALRTGFLPTIPNRILMGDPDTWRHIMQAFERGTVNDTDIDISAWLLLFDSWLYIIEYTKKPEDSPFSKLAALTRNHDTPSLRIAHCIRDLAYGDETRVDDLVAMVHSDDPAYREIFIQCGWIPTLEKAKREGKRGKKK